MTPPTAGTAHPQIRRLRDVAPQAWRNGGGQTRELLTWPPRAAASAGATEPWQLRVSVADIEADGPFSAYPGVQRYFAVLHGAGVRLRWPNRVCTLEAGDEALAFDGAAPPDGQLPAGPTRDLNLMLQGGATGRLWRLEAASSCQAAPGDVLGVYTAAPLVVLDEQQQAIELPADSLLWTSAGAHWTVRVPSDAQADRQPSTRLRAYAFLARCPAP